MPVAMALWIWPGLAFLGAFGPGPGRAAAPASSAAAGGGACGAGRRAAALQPRHRNGKTAGCGEVPGVL